MPQQVPALVEGHLQLIALASVSDVGEPLRLSLPQLVLLCHQRLHLPADASRPFESEDVLFDEATEKQLRMLGAEVMRVRPFSAGTAENAAEHCAEAAARVACTGAGAHESPARAIRFTRAMPPVDDAGGPARLTKRREPTARRHDPDE